MAKRNGDFFGSRTASCVPIERRAPIISSSTITSLPNGQTLALITKRNQLLDESKKRGKYVKTV